MYAKKDIYFSFNVLQCITKTQKKLQEIEKGTGRGKTRGQNVISHKQVKCLLNRFMEIKHRLFKLNIF